MGNVVTDILYNEEEWSDYLSLCKEFRGDGSIPNMKELQSALSYGNRSRFLKQVINPLIEEGVIYRDGAAKSPTAVMRLR